MKLAKHYGFLELDRRIFDIQQNIGNLQSSRLEKKLELDRLDVDSKKRHDNIKRNNEKIEGINEVNFFLFYFLIILFFKIIILLPMMLF